MTDELYKLYLKCFPDYLCSKDAFNTLPKPHETVIFTEYDYGKLIAYGLYGVIPFHCSVLILSISIKVLVQNY
jgi:hypothetical protein